MVKRTASSTLRKRVLITGASQGIGRAIARSLGAAGYDLVLHYRSDRTGAEETKQLVEALRVQVDLIQCDITKRDETRAVLDTVIQHGALWGVVCNAGNHRDGPFAGLSEEDWDSVIGTNLDSFYNVLHPLVMPLIQLRDGGRIVTISSVAGITGNRGQVNYSAAKAGVIGATKALAQELASRRIAVNCIAPGFIDTPMLAELALEEITKKIPMQRLGKPEEVGALAAFLFSPEAEYITGQVISINGGMV